MSHKVLKYYKVSILPHINYDSALWVEQFEKKLVQTPPDSGGSTKAQRF